MGPPVCAGDDAKAVLNFSVKINLALPPGVPGTPQRPQVFRERICAKVIGSWSFLSVGEFGRKLIITIVLPAVLCC